MNIVKRQRFHAFGFHEFEILSRIREQQNTHFDELKKSITPIAKELSDDEAKELSQYVYHYIWQVSKSRLYGDTEQYIKSFSFEIPSDRILYLYAKNLYSLGIKPNPTEFGVFL